MISTRMLLQSIAFKLCYLILQLFHAVVVPAKADQQLTVAMGGDDPPPHPSTEKDKPAAGTHRGPVGNGEYINFMVMLMNAPHKLLPK